MFEVPQALYGLPLNTQLDALETFWEAEVPRVGEIDAKGWASWVSSGCPANVASTPSPVTDMSEKASDPYRQWAQEESWSDRTSSLPTRTTDADQDASDPYTTVLFSDIRPLLLSLQTTEAKNAFRLAWLSFHGLHIPGFCASLSNGSHGYRDDRWSNTHFTTSTFLSSIFPPEGTQRRITADAHAGVLVGREKEYANGFGPVKDWGCGVVGALECMESQAVAALWCKLDISGVDERSVRTLFDQLRLGVEDQEWVCLALAFEAAVSIKGYARFYSCKLISDIEFTM
jgi:hypothetical protein